MIDVHVNVEHVVADSGYQKKRKAMKKGHLEMTQVNAVD
jgi:hypothetical protein